MVIWLLVAKPEISNTRFQCCIKVAKPIINLDTNLDGIIGDTRGDIAEIDIMLN